jgi:hypothetical protein
MNNPISNDVFDSRDLIEYKTFLESELLDAYTNWAEDVNEYKDEDTEDVLIPDTLDEADFIDDEAFTMGNEELIEELNEIKQFCEELEDYGDFEHGEAIISEDYFTDYVEDLVKGLGYLTDNLPGFIEDNIDWDGVAEDLKVDYTEVDYNGTTYLMRC